MRKGKTEPRIFTPPLRELTPETTLGYDVIEWSRDVLGITLLPWEEWLFIHALEIVGSFDSEWKLRFRIVLCLVARQNGKSIMGMVLSLFFMYVLEVPLILGTAQDLSQAEEVWQGAVQYAQDSEELKEAIEKVMEGKGSKELRLTGYRRYKVATANRKNTRGKTSNLVLMDELREHRDFSAWNAASKTTKAVRSALVWCMSNAGDGNSIVLRHLRMQAHMVLGDPDGIVKNSGGKFDVSEEAGQVLSNAIGLFEWSAAPKRSIWDREGWAEANPSMGYGFLDEETIAADAASDPEDGFRTEDLCQWIEATVDPPFPEGAWEAGKDPNSRIADDAPLHFGIDVSSDREYTSIAVCGLTKNQTLHIEVIARSHGMGWVVDWFRNITDAGRKIRVAMQGNGAPVSALVDVLKAIEGLEVIECVGRDLAIWCGRFWDGIAVSAPGSELDAVPIVHRPQPILDLAANVAVTKPLGDGAWAWNRDKSSEDISPLVACTMAHGLATRVEVQEKTSAYEEGGLIFL